jgi:hypothetical protein
MPMGAGVRQVWQGVPMGMERCPDGHAQVSECSVLHFYNRYA